MEPDVYPHQSSQVEIQPMPPLSSEQFAALRADITERGVLVPITIDQTGRVLDGNNRSAIARELGIECPSAVVEVVDDHAAFDLALSLNCARRHLTRDQKRDLIRAELIRRPSDSDRAIARRLGCSPSTVGSVRTPTEGLSNLDTSGLTREEAEESTDRIQKSLLEARGALYLLVGQALINHVTVPEVVGALTMARLRFEKREGHDREATELFSRLVYDYVTEVTTWDATREQFPPHPESDPTVEERAALLEAIVEMGDQSHPADLVGAE